MRGFKGLLLEVEALVTGHWSPVTGF